MSQHNDVKATAVRPYAGPPCLTTTTGERRAPGAAAPARRRRRARVRWLWLAGLLLTMLVGAPSAFAIITCDSTDGCGGGGDTCTEACANGDCDRPASSVDKDYDGVPDQLEYDLAHRFFPNIGLQTFDDLETSYLYQHKPLPYMVNPYRGGASCDEEYDCLEIRYGIAYFKDFGLPLYPICVPFACPPVVGDHVGDSEFYAALVRRTTPYSTAKTDPASWQLIRDFTAAHQGAIGDSSRVGVYGSSPSPSSCSSSWEQYADTPLSSRATVFAAWRKHALYHSVFECFFGALGTDRCLFSPYNMRDYKTVYLLQNIGSPTYHTSFDWAIQDPDGCSYSIWGGAGFGGASPYDEKFLNPIDWCLLPRGVVTDHDEYITITPVTLPVGTSGIDYGQTFDPAGSTGTVEWSISAGTLPSGVTLDTRSGALVGTPTNPGISSFTVRAANSTSLGERTYTLVVKGTSTTDLFADPNPVAAGQFLTLKAEVRTHNGDIPTGTVYFHMSDFSTEKGEILGHATLEGGVAQLTIPAPAAGIRGETVEYVISAIYSSDGYFDPSSTDMTLTVNAASAPSE